MLYFLLHDADVFHGRIVPALAASWRRRSFGPVVELASDLAPALAAFAEQYRLTADERPLLAQLTANQPVDRRMWRHLAGEILLYAAADFPTVQTAPETLAVLLPADLVRRAHAGSRDLDFDGVPYRPGHAGLNDVAVIARLADELAGVDVTRWTPADLAGLPGLDDDDRADELAFACECFAALRSVYQTARDRGCVVVCEDI